MNVMFDQTDFTNFTNEDYIDSLRDDDLEYYSAGVAFGVNYPYSTRGSSIQLQDYSDYAFMLSAKIGM